MRLGLSGGSLNGTPGDATNQDDDQTVIYTYTKGLRTKIRAHLPSSDQDTVYVYGSTKGTPSQMCVASGHLLRAIIYPDSSNTGTVYTDIDSSSAWAQSYAYNAQGEKVYAKDPVGNILEYDYDTGGRMTQQRATTIDGTYDSAIQRIATGYTSRGQVDKVTCYDNATVGAGTAQNEVEYA